MGEVVDIQTPYIHALFSQDGEDTWVSKKEVMEEE
jgi:hypothetical protein